MDWLTIVIPTISHIVAALYLQKQRYNKVITALAWTLFTALSFCVVIFIKNQTFTFLCLLLLQFVTFCLTAKGTISENSFLFLTYANSFGICIGVNLVLAAFIDNKFLLLILQAVIVTLMHLFILKILLTKYKKAKKYFTTGWWKLNIILSLFLVQFLRQYAFNIVDKNSALNLLLDFIIFGIIFNTVLIFIFDAVKNISEINKKTHENDILKDIAYKDALTGMQNRRSYNRFIKFLGPDYQEKCDCFLFVVMDIDKFKSINDTQGHMKGDEILKLVSAAIREQFGDLNSHSFRIGGDEFVLLLENINLSLMEEKIETLNKNLFNSNNVTLSYGYSFVDFNQENPFKEAYKEADAIMYANKQQKKNYIV